MEYVRHRRTRGPPPGAHPMKLMDLIESDELGHLEVEFVNNELRKIPCKQFRKGGCDEGLSCKYFHRYRVGVYTFCQKYKNSNCTVYPCKYIHANPFEQQIYYRTGKFVSPHLQHLNLTGNNHPAKASTVLAHLSRNPYPRLLHPGAPWLPLSAYNRPIPMYDVADIPVPVTPPVLKPPRGPKRCFPGLEEFTNFTY